MKARKKKQAGRKLNGGESKIIDKTHEPPIQTGRYTGTGGDNSPGEFDPKTTLEASRQERCVRRVAPQLKLACPPDPEPPSAAELMAYLQPFWYGPYEAEMWEQYRRWTRPSYPDLRLIEADADRAGMTALDWIFTLALRAIKKYVAKRAHLAAIAAPKPALVEPPATSTAKRRRRPPLEGKTRGLTPRQLEVLATIAEAPGAELGLGGMSWEQVPDSTLLSAADLARLSGLPGQAVAKQLERLRRKDLACFKPVENPGPREPKFLYVVGKVRPTIDAMRKRAGKTSGEMSAERQPKKK